MAAEEIIFKVGVDTGNSVSDLNKVEQGITEIDNAAKGIGSDVASRFDALNKKVESGNMTMRDARKALKEYQDIALQAGRESPIGQAAIKAAGDLKDQIGDLRTELTNAGTDGANMQAALQLGSGIAAGYGAMQGTMALLGGENEKLAESMKKLMAIQTVLQSIEQIRSILEKESFLMQKARTAATFIQTAATSGLAAATGGASGAMAAFNATLMANPIMLVVAGIAALVGAIVWLVSEEEKAEDMNNRINASYDRMSEAADRAATKRRKASQDAIDIAKLEGASIEEIHEMERQAILDTESERVSSLNREKNAINDKKVQYKQALKEDNVELAKQIKDEISQHRKKYRDLAAENGNYKRELKKSDLQFNNDTQARDEAAAEKARQARKAAADRAKQEREKEAQLRIEQQKMLEDLQNLNIEDANTRALMQLQTKHRREREEIVKKYGQNTELEKQLQIQQATELKKLTDEQEEAAKVAQKAKEDKEKADAKALLDKQFADEKAAAELRLLQAEEDFYAQQEAKKKLAEIEMQQALSNAELTANEELLIKKQYDEKIKAIDDETTKHQEANAKMLSDAKLKIAQDSLQLIQNITELFGQKNEKAAKIAFNVDKAAKLASATIAGIEGTINAYKTAQGSPITALFPGYPIVQAGLAAAFAATNVAKIARTQFQSSGGGASSQAAVSAPSQGTPAVPLPEGPTTLTAGLPGGGGQQGGKVYVLDSDITAQQTMSGKVQALATFGG